MSLAAARLDDRRSGIFGHVVVIGDQRRGVVLQGDELGSLVDRLLTVPGAARRYHLVLKCNGIAVAEDVSDQFVPVPVIAEKLVQEFDEFVVVALRVLPNVPVNAVGRQVIGNTLRVMLIPCVKITCYELGRMHTAPFDLVWLVHDDSLASNRLSFRIDRGGLRPAD